MLYGKRLNVMLDSGNLPYLDYQVVRWHVKLPIYPGLSLGVITFSWFYFRENFMPTPMNSAFPLKKKRPPKSKDGLLVPQLRLDEGRDISFSFGE